MKLFKRTHNLEEYQQVFEMASRMPYDWNRVAGYLLGDRSPELRFGGSCFDQAQFVVANLPPGCGKLTWDEGYTHFGVLVNNQHYFDPTFYQSGIDPYSSDNRGKNNAYASRIREGSILVSKKPGYHQVNVDYMNGGFSMEEVDIPVGIAKNLVYESVRGFIGTVPYIKFPTFDGCEVRVGYVPSRDDLEIRTKYSPQIIDIWENRRLADMEYEYGFTAEELLQYFAQSWNRVRRQVNVE